MANGQPPVKSIVVPVYTPDMLVRDVIRGYNGFAGDDPIRHIKNSLHQYTLVTVGGDLHLSVDDPGNKATAKWHQIMPSPRGRRKKAVQTAITLMPSWTRMRIFGGYGYESAEYLEVKIGRYCGKLGLVCCDHGSP